MKLSHLSKAFTTVTSINQAKYYKLDFKNHWSGLPELRRSGTAVFFYLFIFFFKFYPGLFFDSRWSVSSFNGDYDDILWVFPSFLLYRWRMSQIRKVSAARSAATGTSMTLRWTWATPCSPSSGTWWVISRAAVCAPRTDLYHIGTTFIRP